MNLDAYLFIVYSYFCLIKAYIYNSDVLNDYVTVCLCVWSQLWFTRLHLARSCEASAKAMLRRLIVLFFCCLSIGQVGQSVLQLSLLCDSSTAVTLASWQTAKSKCPEIDGHRKTGTTCWSHTHSQKQRLQLSAFVCFSVFSHVSCCECVIASCLSF